MIIIFLSAKIEIALYYSVGPAFMPGLATKTCM